MGNFGSIMCVGHTLGEETVFGSNSGDGSGDLSLRSESVVCSDYACVMQIDVKKLYAMNIPRRVASCGCYCPKDYQSLIYILECHFQQKNEWR